MASPPDHWKPAIIDALKRFVGFLGYARGAAAELLDGTLKLRYCTTIFTSRLLPWSLPRVGNGDGKRQFGIPGDHTDPGGNLGKRVRLTKKTRPAVFSQSNPDPGHPTPRRWKRLRPLPPKEWGVMSASLAIFFLDLGSGEFFAPVMPGTCFRRLQA